MAQTKDSTPTNERLFGLGPSLNLAEGAQLGQFTLGTDRLGAFSFLAGSESFGIIHIVTGEETDQISSTGALASLGIATYVETDVVAADESVTVFTQQVTTDLVAIASSEASVLEAFPALSDTALLDAIETPSYYTELVIADTLEIHHDESYSEATNEAQVYSDPHYIGSEEILDIVSTTNVWSETTSVTSEETKVTYAEMVADETAFLDATMDLINLVEIISIDTGLISGYDESIVTVEQVLSDYTTLVEEVVFAIESDTSTNDDPVIFGHEVWEPTLADIFLDETTTILLTEVVNNIRTEIAYVSTQQIGGIVRTIVSVAEMVVMRTAPDNDLAIMPVSIQETLSAVRTDIDTDTSLIRIVPPEPTVNVTSSIPEPNIYRTTYEDDLAVARNAPEAPYAVSRTFKGEL